MFRHLWTNLLQIWYDERHLLTLHFDASLSDRDLDSRFQKCKETEISVPIILEFPMDLDGIWHCVETCLSYESPTLYLIQSIFKCRTEVT